MAAMIGYKHRHILISVNEHKDTARDLKSTQTYQDRTADSGDSRHQKVLIAEVTTHNFVYVKQIKVLLI